MGKDRLQEICDNAIACEKLVPGIPGELIAAQCILESGWLDHMAGENNCFGIKEYPGCYGRSLQFTYEWFTDKQLNEFMEKGDGRTATLSVPVKSRGDKKKWHVQDWFATFKTLADCFAKRAKLFTQGRYAMHLTAYINDRRLEKFVYAIAPIYATDPDYAEHVMSVINQSDVQAGIEKARRKTLAKPVS